MQNIFYKYNSLYVFLCCLFIGISVMLYVVYEHHGCQDRSPLVAFLDVGQGDSIYVRGGKGETLLIDTGPKDSGVLGQIQKVTGCKRVHVDTMLLTHPDADHIGEAERLIEKGLVGQVVHNGFLDINQGDESATENNLEKVATHKKKMLSGDTLDLSRVHLDVLYPIGEAYVYPGKKPKKIDDNDFSLVVKISVLLQEGEKTFMLTGDAPQKVEEQIISKNCNKETLCTKLRSSILKLGHHGSKYSSGSLFLERVQPAETIVSAGKNNSYHHPNEETILRVHAQERKSKKPLLIRETFTEGNIIYR